MAGLATLWEFLEETKVLGMSLASIIGKVVLVVVVAFIARCIEKLATKATRRVLKKAKVPSATFLINILRGLIWFLALLTVLEPVFGVQPTAFVAALGVGSLALSLGLQDTVSNIVGGLSLMTSKVLETGDVITFGGFTGTVVDINWRNTCVADSYGQVNLIPNSIISKTALIKLSDATKDCCVIQVIIEHGTKLDEARKDVVRIADEYLGDWVDKKREPWIVATIVDIGGIISQVSVPLMHGVSPDHARTRLAEGLSSLSWVRKP